MFEGQNLILRWHTHVDVLSCCLGCFQCFSCFPTLKHWESVEDKVGYHHFHFDRQDPHSTAAALDTCILERIKTQVLTGQVLVISMQCCIVCSDKAFIYHLYENWKLNVLYIYIRVFMMPQSVIRRPPAMSWQYKRPCIKFIGLAVLRRVRSYYLFTHVLLNLWYCWWLKSCSSW